MIEIITGVISGIVSGIGMGGGTILILILSIFVGMEQKVAQATNLIFFIPTLAKYKLIIYIVVSVLPCITEDTLPINESGPYLLNISLNTLKEALPDIGLKIAKGSVSTGKEILLNSGLNIFDKSNIISLDVSKFTAITIANIVGHRCILVSNPSLTPSRKVSNIFTFLYIPYIKINIVIIGIK